MYKDEQPYAVKLLCWIAGAIIGIWLGLSYPWLVRSAEQPLRAEWTGRYELSVIWTSPGYHCLWLDNEPIDCRNDSAALRLRARGVDSKYVPTPGATLRLIALNAQETARAVVPARRLFIPVIRR
jgi:hypothetical protein